MLNVASRDKPLKDLKYLTFGFSFLQDMLESRLVSLFTNHSLEVGLRAQQEPFPCIVKDT